MTIKNVEITRESELEMPEGGNLILKASGWNKLLIPLPEQAKFAVTGYESQVVSFEFGPGDSIQTEPGTLMYATDQIKPEMICSGCWNRCIAGNACCLQRFTSTGTGYVALAPTFPTAKVVPILLSSPDVGEKLFCQRGAFMASYGDVSVEYSVDKNCMRCCCAGMGLVRQKLKGTGTVFLAALGTIVQKVLQEGEVILCDQNCVLAFGRNVTLDVKSTGGLMGMIGGGEGIYNTKLTGP